MNKNMKTSPQNYQDMTVRYEYLQATARNLIDRLYINNFMASRREVDVLIELFNTELKYKMGL